MIKGVNRQVIEITDPGSIYYERAWLIVRPEYTQIQHSVLEKEAKSMLKEIGSPSCMKPKRNFGFWAVRLGLSALLGASVATVLQQLLL